MSELDDKQPKNGVTEPSTTANADRLNGWKEIANHLGKSTKTVRRWERLYKLPIHRVEATGNQVVFAFRHAIDAWMLRPEGSEGPPSAEIATSSGAAAVSESEPAPDRPAASDGPRAFGGHGPVAAIAAALYAALFVLSLWTEMSYAYDRFGGLIWVLSPFVFAWVFAALLIALWKEAAVIAERGPGFPWWSWGVVTIGLALLASAALLILPHEPTILATFTTRTAAAGYVKNIVVHFLPPLFFILPPYHAVLSLQRALDGGRHQDVVRLLSGRRRAVTQSGAFLIRPSMLTIALAALALNSLVGTNYLLDRVLPSGHYQLFTAMLYARGLVWFVLMLLALGWYRTTLDDIKRKAIAMRSEPSVGEDLRAKVQAAALKGRLTTG